MSGVLSLGECRVEVWRGTNTSSSPDAGERRASRGADWRLLLYVSAGYECTQFASGKKKEKGVWYLLSCWFVCSW